MTHWKNNEHIRSVDDVKKLVSLFESCPAVMQKDKAPYREAWDLADSLGELEAKMREFLDGALPLLTSGAVPPSEVPERLREIGEIFRQILYFMLEQPRYFRYLVPPDVYWEDSDRQEASERAQNPESNR